ncbi:guanitoxin biosynthesis heme-dependent pre-guanitoxin N-hydroxylase GntA [Qipengyuania seohaensis]|uniref:guanitoxin biosynthesis heme-dependent pre-guanitoxin N-hydroxylase GntA n=1 Tax=Qipengyuania seohaensis TaxID=266951 RepID=UPI000C22567A|nr:guanitoxin biosynthesis heme-dependent pre-guanitoxin N-hydroxylase GntA [Qipengyuania seohaensis]
MQQTSSQPEGPNQLCDATLVDSLITHVDQPEFPCVGAKSAKATDNLQIETAWRLTSAWNDIQIHERLLDWSDNYDANPSGLRSLAVVFAGPLDLDEEQFETAMWERLQSLAAKDDWRGQPYSEKVSSDPSDPHFSLSFGKQAYFVVGLHPNASRSARRTPYPTLVFNLHDQFEQLRASQKYERMRQAILQRDAELDGSINPMLARHGEDSEARQYSGRRVSEDWKCPFSDPRDQ